MCAKKARKARGLSLPELMVVMLLTGMLFAITHMIIARTIELWWRVNAHQNAEQQLYRAQRHLERDLRSASFDTEASRQTIGLKKAPSELQSLAGADGDVLWFLSAVDPASGNFVRTRDGAPFWQRNILYYAVTPTTSGLANLGYLGLGKEVAGYEVACPYKILVRKEIDSDIPTKPNSNESDKEKLLSYSDLAPFIKRPSGYDCTDIRDTNSTVIAVSANLLSFRCELLEDAHAVSFDVRCTGIEQARKEGPISDRDLYQAPSTRGILFLMAPPNHPTSDNES